MPLLFFAQKLVPSKPKQDLYRFSQVKCVDFCYGHPVLRVQS